MKLNRNRFGALLVAAGCLCVSSAAMGQAGAVVAWGRNDYGQCDVPAYADSGVTAIAGGGVYTIALKVDSNDTDGDGIPNATDNCPNVANPTQADCDGNGVGDACETFTDCNLNGILDSCEILSGAVTDINGNNIPDSCDVASGLLNDYNHNGIADSAELIAVTAQLQIVTSQLNAVTAQIECGDLNNDGSADSQDLGLLLLRYGACQADSVTTPQEPMIFQTTQTPVLNKK